MASLLLTRPEKASGRFADLVHRQIAAMDIVISPLMRIEKSQDVALSAQEVVIFTSHYGVDFAPEVNGRLAYCVGRATAEAAQARGYQVTVGAGDAAALIKRILADAPKQPLVHIRGAHSRGEISETLRSAGIDIRDHVAYQQHPLPLNAQALAVLSGQDPVIVPLFSPRSAKLFLENGPYLAPIWAVAISQTVAQTVAGKGFHQIEVADTPDAQAVYKSIQRLLAAGDHLEGVNPAM